MAYKAEVIADNSGKWVSNQLSFATAEEAAAYVDDLARRWTLVRETRVVLADGSPTHKWEHGGVSPVHA